MAMVWEERARPVSVRLSGDADTNLVRMAQAGAPEAFSELVRRYQDRVYAIIAGMVADEEDALDLTQETFIKAYMALDRFRQDAGFFTWLYRIAVHCCIDFSRKRKRRLEPLPLDQYVGDDPSLEPRDSSPARDPERAAMNGHLRAAIRTALQQITEPFRTAVILRDMEDLSQEEIARIMGCPLGTAKTRIHRGRCQLRDLLRPFIQPDV
jgi:RNA polymerase sigma-70 factor (ECF subfamily)